MDGQRDFPEEQEPRWYPGERGYAEPEWRTAAEDRYPGETPPVPEPRDGSREGRYAAPTERNGPRYEDPFGADPLSPDPHRADPLAAERADPDRYERRPADPGGPGYSGDRTDPVQSAYGSGNEPLGARPTDGGRAGTDPVRAVATGRASDRAPAGTPNERAGGPARHGEFPFAEAARAAEFPVIEPGRPADRGQLDRGPADRGSLDWSQPAPTGQPAEPSTGALPAFGAGQQPAPVPESGTAQFHTQQIDRRDLRRPDGAGGPTGIEPGGPVRGPEPIFGGRPDPGLGARPELAPDPIQDPFGSYGMATPNGAISDGVYRTRRPARAVLLALLTVVFEVPALRLLLSGATADRIVAGPVVAGILLVLGLPIFAAGLYGLSTGAAALTDPARGWLRPPTGYLTVGLVLLVGAALAAG